MDSAAEQKIDRKPTLQDIRNVIPKHCFHNSAVISTSYIARDLTYAICLFILAGRISVLESTWIKYPLWAVYGFLQGLVFTGIWIIAHECGHGALFTNNVINDTVGFVLHSLLGVPYFSWKYSHARHHRYANHMSKDTAFVPSYPQPVEHRGSSVARLVETTEDSPLATLVRLVGHQLIGWPMYLLCHITAGKTNFKDGKGPSWVDCHFNPSSKMFLRSQRYYILLSDLGLLCLIGLLTKAASGFGFETVALAYGIPYLWVNHWIVAITYLHHTHVSAPHFEPHAWTFMNGALSTVDRDFGLIGRHMFHGIIEYHVVHHLFPRIPFYHAEEATAAMQQLLGKTYLRDETPFYQSLWETFSTPRYLRPTDGNSGVLMWAEQKGQPEP